MTMLMGTAAETPKETQKASRQIIFQLRLSMTQAITNAPALNISQ